MNVDDWSRRVLHQPPPRDMAGAAAVLCYYHTTEMFDRTLPGCEPPAGREADGWMVHPQHQAVSIRFAERLHEVLGLRTERGARAWDEYRREMATWGPCLVAEELARFQQSGHVVGWLPAVDLRTKEEQR